MRRGPARGPWQRHGVLRLALLLCALGAARAEPPRDAAAQVDALLQRALPDAASVTDKALSQAERGLLAVQFEGVRLRSPALASGDTAPGPVLFARRSSGQRDYEVAPERNAVLVAADLHRGELRAGWALRPRKRLAEGSLPRSGQGAPPDASERDSVSVKIERLDARALLGLPAGATGPFALTLLSYDWASNTIRVALGADAAAPPPLAGRGAVDADAALGAAQAASRRAAFAAAGGAVEPLLPGGGEALVLTAPTRSGAGQPLPLFGELHTLVPGELSADRRGRGSGSGARTEGFATLGVLLLQRDEVQPVLLQTAIALAAPARDVVAGARFRVDLRRLSPTPLPAGEYLVYAFCGALRSGPHRLTLTP